MLPYPLLDIGRPPDLPLCQHGHGAGEVLSVGDLVRALLGHAAEHLAYLVRADQLHALTVGKIALDLGQLAAGTVDPGQELRHSGVMPPTLPDEIVEALRGNAEATLARHVRMDDGRCWWCSQTWLPDTTYPCPPVRMAVQFMRLTDP